MLKKCLQRVLGIESVKELIYTQNNNILAHERATEKLMREYERDNIKLSQMLENAKEVLKAKESHIDFQNNMISERDLEIEKLTEIIKNNKDFQDDIKEYLKTVADILQNNQEKILKRRKPTRAELMTEKFYKIPEETMNKLK